MLFRSDSEPKEEMLTEVTARSASFSLKVKYTVGREEGRGVGQQEDLHQAKQLLLGPGGGQQGAPVLHHTACNSTRNT